MRYDRKIKYLDYCENGERVRGSGFLKTEIFQSSFKMELTVKGVRCAGELTGDVIICGAGREEVLGKIKLEGGQGEFRHVCQVSPENGSIIGGTGIACDELTGIKIPLGEGREIVCTWDTSNSAAKSPAELLLKPTAKPQTAPTVKSKTAPTAKPQTAPTVKPQTAPTAKPQTGLTAKPQTAPTVKPQTAPTARPQTGPTAKPQTAPAAEPQTEPSDGPTAKQQEKARKEVAEEYIPRLEQSEPHREVKAQELRETEETRSKQITPRREGKAQEPRETEAARPDKKEPEQQPETVALLENKWLQLCAIYPHIKPFRDQREYLSIGPEDFVLFSSESYKAASNSFMLHGYYNYRHLILTREERKGEIVYYVGVPGNYYDREKQVAIMFGFESFECAQEPAQSSDFGYYMMKVQL